MIISWRKHFRKIEFVLSRPPALTLSITPELRMLCINLSGEWKLVANALDSFCRECKAQLVGNTLKKTYSRNGNLQGISHLQSDFNYRDETNSIFEERNRWSLVLFWVLPEGLTNPYWQYHIINEQWSLDLQFIIKGNTCEALPSG